MRAADVEPRRATALHAAGRPRVGGAPVSLLSAYVLTVLLDEPAVRLTKTAYRRCEQWARRRNGSQLARP